jgi:hypothetical protein
MGSGVASMVRSMMVTTVTGSQYITLAYLDG